jgi:hypothetical protein
MRLRKHVIRLKKKKKTQYLFWTEPENRRYFAFVKTHANLFRMSFEERNRQQINVLMSRKVRTRTSHQCHSYHQTMVRKFGGLDKLLNFIGKEDKIRGTIA